MGCRNAIVGQSGGPTAVINRSLYGVISEWKEKMGSKIYGAIHGIEGVLKEEFVNLSDIDDRLIEGLQYTPGAALGGCRYMLKDNEDIQKVLRFFDKYDIGYFFYIGGNDSMDTANKVYEAAKRADCDLKVIGIPKTIDNDLVNTHHCPGFGSAAKYVATSVREAGIHTESMYTSEPVSILTTVGRNTGWLARASIIAKRSEKDAPHLIYIPEVAFSEEKFLSEVEEVYRKVGGVFIVTGEGLKDKDGNYVGVNKREVSIDAFGHPELGSVGESLKMIIEERLKLRTRTIKLDICQQSACHFASLRDAEDAELVGRMAVRVALDGVSGKMVTLGEVKGETGITPLSSVANIERELEEKYIHDDEAYKRYVIPLVLGEVRVPIVDGLPAYVRGFVK